MTIDELMQKLDKYVTHNMTYFEKKSDSAYRAQNPTYFLGNFECAYQFAYGCIDGMSIQDAIDYIMDDVEYIITQHSNYRKIPYYNGYVNRAYAIKSFMDNLRFSYEETTNYPLKHVWSCVSFDNLQDSFCNIY